MNYWQLYECRKEKVWSKINDKKARKRYFSVKKSASEEKSL